MNVLVTGGTGFLGSFMAERRAAHHDRVWATYLDEPDAELCRLEGVRLVRCDVRKREEVERVVAQSRPEVVFHFAAQTYIDISWADPRLTLDTNAQGTLLLLEAIRAAGNHALVVVACSSAQYGDSGVSGKAFSEEDPFRPLSPYGLSKVNQDVIAELYARRFGMRVIRARIFNTIGPRKNRDFLADFCGQIVAIEAGEASPLLRVGDLNSQRDLTDVEDTTRALDLISARGRSGEAYNICSGRAVRIGEVLKLLLWEAALDVRIQVETSRLRPGEERIILGDNRKLVASTGWTPEVSLQQTVHKTLEYWRQHSRRGSHRPQTSSVALCS